MSKLIREFRYAGELRSAGRRLQGYAVTYNSLSENLGGFQEQIAPGAFDDSLSDGDDIRFLAEHDPKMLLGRNTSGTLVLRSDNVGIAFSCELPKTQLGNDILEQVTRGDLSGMSFGMYVESDSWQSNRAIPLRTVTKGSLFDVSIVSTPAYSSTNVAVRSLFPDGNIVVPTESTFGGVPVSQLSDDDFRLYARLRLMQASL